MTATELENERVSRVRLRVPPRPVAIAIGRSVIRRIVTFRDQDAESSFLVAFTEIVANAVEEHERLGLAAMIDVEIMQGPVGCVRIIDSGAGFELTRFSPAPVSDDASDVDVSERGRGLALARAFVGDLAVESSDSGTIVTLPLDGVGIVR